jgi:hypothetical protein
MLATRISTMSKPDRPRKPRHQVTVSGRGNLRRNFQDCYREAKVRGIITSLDPGWSPPVPKPPQRHKSPAIVRFLKSHCPHTVKEFRERYGEPRMDMGVESAREHGLWSVAGQSVIDVDYMMMYANIIKHQVLYVYAKNGVITHIAVVDPTDWKRGDFKPFKGPSPTVAPRDV